MVLVCVFGALSGHETDLWGKLVAFGHPLTNGGLSAFSKRFGMHILRNQAWYVTVVAWDMLLAHLMLVSTYPCGGVATAVAKNVFVRLILVSHVLEGSLAVECHCGGLFRAAGNRCLMRIEEINDRSVDVSSSHTKLINLGRHVPSVARHVLFVEAHFAISWAE